MHLHTALERIAAAYDLNADTLKAYADEDPHTGWDKGAGVWPVGSLWRVEGQILYALVRALQPAYVLELGTGYGCSATHIASALVANGRGELHCVDNQGDPTAIGRIGAGIPADLRPLIAVAEASIDEFVATCVRSYDLIFEDGIHSPQQVYNVWQQRDPLLEPGGMLVSHDAMHYIVGPDVRAAIRRAGVEDALYLDVEPSDCGVAVWRKAGQTVTDYTEWTIADLRAALQRRGVDLPARVRKADLIAMLQV